METTKSALFTLFWPQMASDSLDFCSLSLEMSRHHLNDILVLLISRLDHLMVKVYFDPWFGSWPKITKFNFLCANSVLPSFFKLISNDVMRMEITGFGLSFDNVRRRHPLVSMLAWFDSYLSYIEFFFSLPELLCEQFFFSPLLESIYENPSYSAHLRHSQKY